jgi:hypothetical protein
MERARFTRHPANDYLSMPIAEAHPRQLKDKSFLLFEIEKGGRMI